MSALHEWGSLAGNEVWNNARSVAYTASLSVWPALNNVGCQGIADALGDPPYTTPAADDATWYDPGVPDSAGFAGLYVTEIVGLDSSTAGRNVIDTMGDGAVLGPLRRGPRTLVVTGWLLGQTCCSVSYGLAWLTRALADSTCGPAGPADLCYLACCPGDRDEDLRTLHDVGLVGGPTVLERRARASATCGRSGCAEALRVEFTLTAGNPYAFRPPVPVAGELILADGPVSCVQWVRPGHGQPCRNGCPQADIVLDPACGPAPRAPAVPTAGDPCACLPLTSARTCLPVPDSAFGEWAEAVPTLTVKASGGPLRNLIVTFFDNPLGLDCDEVDECAVAAQVIVSYMPAWSELTIDGERQEIRLRVGVNDADATALVYGAGGGPFDWPVLRCAPLCVCADADVDNTFPGDPNQNEPPATLSLFLTGREP